MIHTEEILFQLIRREVCEGTTDPNLKELITPEILTELYNTSKTHDLTHIVGQALHSLGIEMPAQLAADFEREQMIAIYRYQNLQFEFNQLCKTLSEAKIPYLPLKGAVMRDYYPTPWMRTSCDIDVLVHEEDLDRAIEVLTKKLGYSNKGRGFHDVSLFSKSKVHVELHFTLADGKRIMESYNLRKNVWEYATPKVPGSYQYEMSDDIFYFYHVSHMANHLYGGGCGIRPFLDLWLLEHKVEGDRNARNALLEQTNLLTFANSARELCEVWFSGKQYTKLAFQLQQFILGGGVYGSTQNKVAVQQAERGGKFKYILSRIFLPRQALKHLYPILETQKWLFPFLQVVRWFGMLRPRKLIRVYREMRAVRQIRKKSSDDAGNLFSEIGLQ